jgi:hypothetical protein
VQRLVKITLDPVHILVLLAEKFAFRVHPCKLIASVTCAPEHPVGSVSTTPILPLLAPKLTVILLLFGPVAPEVMVAPVGTLHVYVDPVIGVTLYTIPVALQAGV